MGVTPSHLESYKPKGAKLPPEKDIAVHTPSLYNDADIKGKSSDEEYVVTAVCGGGERVLSLSEDVHQVIWRMRQNITVTGENCGRNTVT